MPCWRNEYAEKGCRLQIWFSGRQALKWCAGRWCVLPAFSSCPACPALQLSRLRGHEFLILFKFECSCASSLPAVLAGLAGWLAECASSKNSSGVAINRRPAPYVSSYVGMPNWELAKWKSCGDGGGGGGKAKKANKDALSFGLIWIFTH